MKIVFLNVNGGSSLKELLKFISFHIDTTDIFCFQEALETENFKKALSLLSKSYVKFTTGRHLVPNIIDTALTTFIKKEYLDSNNKKYLFTDNPSIGIGLQTKVSINKKTLNIINFHGLPYPGDKLDTKERKLQSKSIIQEIKKYDAPIILGGDFNLYPNTESIKIIEDFGLVNLIKKFNIKNTRNELIWNMYPDSKQYFADYIFVSPSIEVESLNVPYVLASDHLPLILKVLP